MRLVKFVVCVILLGVIVYVYPTRPDTFMHRVQALMKPDDTLRAEYNQLILQKEAKLGALEKGIELVTDNFDRAVANAPICPQTGLPAVITITEDSRPGIEEECEQLREEIKALEEKLAALD